MHESKMMKYGNILFSFMDEDRLTDYGKCGFTSNSKLFHSSPMKLVGEFAKVDHCSALMAV